MIEIASETPLHAAGVRALLLAAFPTALEADLVERLRADGDLAIALVALTGNRVVGHVGFSSMTAPMRALALAPVAVDAAYRRRGIAKSLIEAGLARAKAQAWDAVFVLGEPAYYRRFGFDAAAADKFSSVFAGPCFMALALRQGSLPAEGGRIEHAGAFGVLPS